MTTEQRLTELEIKVAFQEDTVKALNDVIYQQQKSIDRLEVLLRTYRNHLGDIVTESPSTVLVDEKPPHY